MIFILSFSLHLRNKRSLGNNYSPDPRHALNTTCLVLPRLNIFITAKTDEDLGAIRFLHPLTILLEGPCRKRFHV